MAKHYNLSEDEFARNVVSSSLDEQQRLLRGFYVHEDYDLKDVIRDPDVETEVVTDARVDPKVAKKG
jgi:hypothetical protein